MSSSPPLRKVIDISLIEDCIVVTGGETLQAERKSLRFEEVEWLKLSFRSEWPHDERRKSAAKVV